MRVSIATPLNSTRRRVELCRYKRAFSHRQQHCYYGRLWSVPHSKFVDILDTNMNESNASTSRHIDDHCLFIPHFLLQQTCWEVTAGKRLGLFRHCAHMQSITRRLLQTYTNTTSHAHYTAVPYGKVTAQTGCWGGISCISVMYMSKTF